MTIPLNDLLISLKWEEEGANIPDRVRSQLAELGRMQAQLARQGGLGPGPAGPAAPAGGVGGNRFQTEWASNAEILQAMARDAAKARGAVVELRDSFESVPVAAAPATRHIGELRRAAANAAFQITGMSGSAGRLASGLLMFAGGSGPVLAAALALGTLGLAFRAVTADARRNREENERVVTSLKALGAHGTVTAIKIQIAELERQRDDPSFAKFLTGAKGVLHEGPFVGAQNAQVARREELNRQIATLRGQLGEAGLDFTEPGRQAVRSATIALETAKLRQRLTGATFATGGALTAADITQRTRAFELGQDPQMRAVAAQVAAKERETAATTAATEAQLRVTAALEDAAIRLRMVGEAPQAVTEALQIRALERAGQPPALAAELAARERRAAATSDRADLLRELRSPEFAANTASTLIQGVRQGGAGAVGALGSVSMGLSSMKGIAGTAAAGPLGWIGAGFSVLGALFQSSQEKAAKKIVDAINRQGKEIAEKGSRVFVVDGRTGAVEELRQADDHDAATRVRGYAGVTG